jgi:hypothetical protein
VKIKPFRIRIPRRDRRAALAAYGKRQSGRQWVRLRKDLRRQGHMPDGYL